MTTHICKKFDPPKIWVQSSNLMISDIPPLLAGISTPMGYHPPNTRPLMSSCNCRLPHLWWIAREGGLGEEKTWWCHRIYGFQATGFFFWVQAWSQAASIEDVTLQNMKWAWSWIALGTVCLESFLIRDPRPREHVKSLGQKRTLNSKELWSWRSSASASWQNHLTKGA